MELVQKGRVGSILSSRMFYSYNPSNGSTICWWSTEIKKIPSSGLIFILCGPITHDCINISLTGVLHCSLKNGYCSFFFKEHLFRPNVLYLGKNDIYFLNVLYLCNTIILFLSRSPMWHPCTNLSSFCTSNFHIQLVSKNYYFVTKRVTSEWALVRVLEHQFLSDIQLVSKKF